MIKVIARKYLFSAVATGGKETEINQQLHSIRFVMFLSYLLLAHSFRVFASMRVIFSSLAAARRAIHIHEQYSLVRERAHYFPITSKGTIQYIHRCKYIDLCS